jgi:hypothetical protein
MLFHITSKRYISVEQLRTDTLINAYFIIQNYPLQTSDLIVDKFIQQRYKMSLKNMCIELLLNLTFYKDNTGDLILLFKDRRYDVIAQLITYGNGTFPGSKILQTALAT